MRLPISVKIDEYEHLQKMPTTSTCDQVSDKVFRPCTQQACYAFGVLLAGYIGADVLLIGEDFLTVEYVTRKIAQTRI